MINTSEISTEETVGLYDTIYGLLTTPIGGWRPDISKNSLPGLNTTWLSNRGQCCSLHSSPLLEIKLFGHLGKSKTSNSNKLPHASSHYREQI